MQSAELAPARMASDSLLPFKIFEAGAFHSMLAGYVQSAGIQLSQCVRGTSQNHLNRRRLPGIPPTAAAECTALARVLRALGLTTTGRVLVLWRDSGDPVSIK